jgi:ABC-type hemin transport system substrate-binding protein
MRPPRLSFACELDTPRLTELFADASVITELQALGARVAVMLSDYSAERAQAIQQLNQAGIPVVAIPLVPAEDGYYFTADNLPQAQQSYERWKAWTHSMG